jgi:5-methylcytosine-specific restriction endonuclease McrA
MSTSNGNVQTFRITGPYGRRFRRAYRELQKQLDPLCRYCRLRPGETIDHLHPLSKGGDDSPQNLLLCCSVCNRLKDAMLPDEFHAMLQTMAAEVGRHL